MGKFRGPRVWLPEVFSHNWANENFGRRKLLFDGKQHRVVAESEA